MVAGERDDSGADGGFDPRYDPTFQRGYQPRPGERPQTRVRADAPDSAYRRPSSLLQRDERPAAPSEPLTAYEQAARVFEDEDGAVASGAVAAGPSAAGQALIGAPVVVSAPGLLAGLELNPRRNPFILALWLVGGGFVILGVVLYTVSVTSSYNGPTPSTDVGALVFAQLGWMFSGPLITVGLLTLVGLLFLTALAGRRKGGTAQPPAEDAEL